jgi:ankyrin repeat protein
MFASVYGHIEVVKLLIEAGADVNAQPKALQGDFHRQRAVPEYLGPALIDASRGGHSEIIKLLIEAGADVNAKDLYGRTALMYAWHTEIVKLLIEAGAKY